MGLAGMSIPACPVRVTSTVTKSDQGVSKSRCKFQNMPIHFFSQKFQVFQIWNLPYCRECFKARVQTATLCMCSSNAFKVVRCVLTTYIELNGALITTVSVISERHSCDTHTIIIYNIINIYKFVLVSSSFACYVHRNSTRNIQF